MRTAVALATLLLASAASGYDFSGNEIFIPIASSVAGANGTQWQTDLVVSNRHEHFETEVSMFFFPNGGEGTQHRFHLAPLQTVTMKNVVPDTFGLIGPQAGTIWMGAANDAVKLAAHVRIYNTGNPTGEFGQLVPGLPPEQLSRTAWLHGLNGVDGNRSNVGIGNPANSATSFSVTWYDKDGESHGSVSLSVQPWAVYLINDIFDFTGMPRDEAITIRVRASVNPIYAYGSVVRNDTGDAYTVIGTGPSE